MPRHKPEDARHWKVARTALGSQKTIGTYGEGDVLTEDHFVTVHGDYRGEITRLVELGALVPYFPEDEDEPKEPVKREAPEAPPEVQPATREVADVDRKPSEPATRRTTVS